MHTERGAILLVVLAVLAMMAILGASFSRSATSRLLAARDFLRAESEACLRRDLEGGKAGGERATIGEGAEGASSNEGTHGPQTFSPGGDDRLGCGTDRQGHRQGGAHR
ncbi:hypothetical protein [Luteibacter sp.]|uniref:hypothetical protein n=1 Tax=Luteibacter sp. TaxID=1886636 RepID=UPI002F3FD9B6